MSESSAGNIRDDNEKPRAVPVSTAARGSVVSIAALVVAVAALGLAGWTALRGSGSAEPGQASTAFSDAERAEAQTKLCTAFDRVRQGVTSNTNAVPPGGPEDHAGALGVMANARLSLAAGGQYLLSRIDAAAPEELAAEARDLANTLSDIGATTIAGVSTTDGELARQMQEAETLSTSIADRCDGI